MYNYFLNEKKLKQNRDEQLMKEKLKTNKIKRKSKFKKKFYIKKLIK